MSEYYFCTEMLLWRALFSRAKWYLVLSAKKRTSHLKSNYPWKEKRILRRVARFPPFSILWYWTTFPTLHRRRDRSMTTPMSPCLYNGERKRKTEDRLRLIQRMKKKKKMMMDETFRVKPASSSDSSADWSLKMIMEQTLEISKLCGNVSSF